MKKIELEIPEWAQDRNIYIFAGIEVLASYCVVGDSLWMKTKRCSICGLCCTVKEPFHLGSKPISEIGWTEEGLKQKFLDLGLTEEAFDKWRKENDPLLICKYLQKEVWNFDRYDNQTVYPCTAPGTQFPWSCAVGFTCGYDEWREWKPFCVIEHKKYGG